MGVAISGEPDAEFVGPGESMTFAPGVEHRFWNAGEDDLAARRRGLPARQPRVLPHLVYASVKAHGGRPGAFDGAFLLTRYRSEFAMTSIPAPVRRFVLPLQLFLGKLLRRYDDFADAPAPVRRPTSATLPGRSTTSARSSAG